MYERLEFEIRGISPLICHNGHLANPMNKWSKQLKEISGKRKKTDSDFEAMAKIEWFGGLYVDENDCPIIPGVNIESMMASAGAAQKLKKVFTAGLISDGNWPIKYDGPKTAAAIWEKAAFQFIDQRNVKLNGKVSIVRTRPIFRKWSLKFSLDYLPDLLNHDQVKQALIAAGRIIGLGDFKPKFGRFEVVA